ncbi:hypothetical protein QR680_003309 [Steinernema hermaphroditum]|uniref:RING-type domain-containing protein n=1 Tax=Steinernema hermaphroditum TaxID=289476 RepID=A0AA39H783_9BILA|nr:hypothetical protein QR680_003309 [Steinernema hermaphroditum]
MSIASTSVSTKKKSSRSPPDDSSMPPILSRANRGRESSQKRLKDDAEPGPSSVETKLKPELQDGYFLEVRSINQHITCPLCDGYFVEATTVVDCLHTFCKSCLLQHFEEVDNCCPKCNSLIHQSHPSHYVSFDRTMQDIVYKLVPGLQSEEIRLRREFASSLESSVDDEQEQEEKVEEEEEEDIAEPEEDLPGPSSRIMRSIKQEIEEEVEELPPEEVPEVAEESFQVEEDGENRCCLDDLNTAHHRGDDSMAVVLQAGENFKENVDRPVVWLSGLATINTIKRYLAMVLHEDVSKYNDFDVFCNNELMGRDFSMKFIRLTRWRNKADDPLVLIYKSHMEF